MNFEKLKIYLKKSKFQVLSELRYFTKFYQNKLQEEIYVYLNHISLSIIVIIEYEICRWNTLIVSMLMELITYEFFTKIIINLSFLYNIILFDL